MLKRLVAIIFVVVMLLTLGATPVLADNGKGPPSGIRNWTGDPGEVIWVSDSQGPPYYIYIYLPDESDPSPLHPVIWIAPTNYPAQPTTP